MSSHSRGSHHKGGSHGESHGQGGGPLVKVGFARTQAEAEMLQGLLLDSGIPSVLKRTRGFDNPDFLAAGPHDLLVGSDLAEKARGLLAETTIEGEDEVLAEIAGADRRARAGDGTPASRLALGVIAALLAAVILVWVLYQLS